MGDRCPTCGSPVEVVTGGEGTSHYRPRCEQLREAMNLAIGFLDALAEQTHRKGLERLAAGAATHRDRLRAALSPDKEEAEE